MTLSEEEIEQLRSLCKDDTAFKQLRATLQRSAESQRFQMARFKALLDQTVDAVHLVNIEGYYIHVNDWGAEITGYTRQELLDGMHFSDVILPEELLKAHNVFERLLRGEHVPPYERRMRRKDGQVLAVEINIQLIRDQDGLPVAIQSLVRDLSERKKREAQTIEENNLRTALAYAQQMSDLKSAMMIRLAHEFRTPLTIIQTSAKLLESYYERLTPEARKQQLAKITDQIRRLDEMMSDISLVVRWQGRDKFAVLMPFDLVLLVRRVVANSRQSQQTHSLVLSFQVEHCLVSADETLIDYSVTKLLQNAIKFSPSNSQVTLSVGIRGDYVEFVIQDEGIGIPLDEQTRVFEPFYRASNVGEIGGMGIGLTIVRQAVEAHGGAIYLESKVGHGTRIQIALPIFRQA